MKKKTSKKLVALLLVISMMIPIINYYEKPVKVDGKPSKKYEEVVELPQGGKQEQKVEEKEDFSNSPILRYVNKESFNKKGHVKRLKDEEKLNTFMFENTDGTKTMYMMYENVKYKDKFGNIKDKDISLKEENESYKVRDNNVGLSIPKSPQKGIEVNYDNNIVKITPIRNLTTSKVLTTMENNAVTYKNYYGEGIDLKYTPLLSGVKEDIII